MIDLRERPSAIRYEDTPVCAFCAKNECFACRPDQFPCRCANADHPNRDSGPDPYPGEGTSDEQRYMDALLAAGYYETAGDVFFESDHEFLERHAVVGCVKETR